MQERTDRLAREAGQAVVDGSSAAAALATATATAAAATAPSGRRELLPTFNTALCSETDSRPSPSRRFSPSQRLQYLTNTARTESQLVWRARSSSSISSFGSPGRRWASPRVCRCAESSRPAATPQLDTRPVISLPLSRMIQMEVTRKGIWLAKGRHTPLALSATALRSMVSQLILPHTPS